MINIDIYLANSVSEDTWNTIFEFLNKYYEYDYYYCREYPTNLHMRISLECHCVKILSHLRTFEKKLNYLLCNYPVNKINLQMYESNLEEDLEMFCDKNFYNKYINSYNGYYVDNFTENLMRAFGFHYEIVRKCNIYYDKCTYVNEEYFIKSYQH